MTKAQDECTHSWVLDITPSTCECVCVKCYLKFKPQPQQIPYHGVLPEKFKRKWR